MGCCKRTIVLLAVLGGGCSSHMPPAIAPAAVSSPAPAAPASDPVVARPPVDPAHVRTFGYWLDGRAETAASTNVITLAIGCGDDVAFAEAQLDLQRDTRGIVWFANVFTYGPTARSRNGYSLRSDASACWQELKAQIDNHRDRTVAVWLLDEPDSVAWGDMVPGGPYDPNLYTDMINAACAMMHADFPTLRIGLNFGGVPDGLRVPPCLEIVGLEAYGDTWASDLDRLEALIPTPLWLLSPAFVDGDPAQLDAPAAGRVQAQAARARVDGRVTGLYPFLWCCDDTTTGDKTFYTVSGGRLPLTRAALDAAGRAIVGR